MRAWYYSRGRLNVVPGEHFGVVAAVYRGKVRVRYHEDSDTLAVQARSLNLCRQAVKAVLDRTDVHPEKICAEWPGQYREVFLSDWK